jgi:hypothetical protein
MYQLEGNGYGLGFSLPRWLTPPRSIRKAVGGIIAQAVKGQTVTVQTPGGPMTFDLGNPADVDALKKIRVSFGPKGENPTAADQAAGAVNKIPGGLGTLALVGAGVLALVMFSRKRA